MRASPANIIKAFVLVGIGIAIGVSVPGQKASGAKDTKRPDPPRIGYVNVTKVLREFKSANLQGKQITDKREAYLNKVRDEKESLAKIDRQIADSKDCEKSKALADQATKIKSRIADVDREAQRELIVLSNDTIVKVYRQIQEVMVALAKERELDVVEGFPAAPRPEDAFAPQTAQLMLQTPALIPFYLKPELDYTAEVIERLNKKYPPEKDSPAK